MVVDDSLLVREGLVALLVARGHEVVEVAEHPSAVPALVRSGTPDVVLTSSYAGGGLGPRLEHTPVLGFVQKDQLTVARLAELFG